MKEIFANSFRILKQNLLFIQPILLYLLLMLIALPYIFSPLIPLYSKGIFVSCMFLFSAAMFAGIFYINEKGVADYSPEDDEEEKTKKTIKNFKSFFEGVGGKFFKVLCATVLFCLVYFVVLKGLIVFCTHYFGVPSIFSRFEEFTKVETVEQVRAFIASLDRKDLYLLSVWTYSFAFSTILLNYFGFLYYAVIVSEKDNFLICFFKAVLFGLKNILASIFIMFVMSILYLIINLLVAAFGSNPIMLSIFIILLVLYFNYYIILVLYIYNDRTKSNSDSGSECIGENESCD